MEVRGQEARYFILCNSCARHMDEPSRVMLALFGPQGLGDEDAVLLCVPWAQRIRVVGSTPFRCDGCKQLVSVARSSRWFIDLHRQERE